MTNEAYIFNETNRERAITRRSARCKKNGSKSKSCKLGVDRLSNKQIEKLHGPVQSWKMTNFYSWKEFKSMPNDIQVEYINYLIDKYGVGLATISSRVFYKSSRTLQQHFRRLDVEDQIHIPAKGGSIARDAYLRLEEDIKAYNSPVAEEEPAIEAAPELEAVVIESEAEPIVDPEKPVVSSMAFSTEYVADKIDFYALSYVENMFKGRKIHVSISIEAV